MDEDDLAPMLPPLLPPPRRRLPPPPRGFLPPPPPPPPSAEDSDDMFDFEYPLPEFPPLIDFYPPPPPPPYPAIPRDEDDESPVGGKSRARREALIDTLEVHDPDEWWTDVDGGSKNKVGLNLSFLRIFSVKDFCRMCLQD